MTVKTLDRYIDVTPDTAGGQPRIAGRRIKVQDVVIWHERLGRSVDEIATEYDLSLAEIHAALAYYFDHREEIDHSLAESAAFVEALRGEVPSKLSRKLQG